jgi:hypothetical protein
MVDLSSSLFGSLPEGKSVTDLALKWPKFKISREMLLRC